MFNFLHCFASRLCMVAVLCKT